MLEYAHSYTMLSIIELICVFLAFWLLATGHRIGEIDLELIYNEHFGVKQ